MNISQENAENHSGENKISLLIPTYNRVETIRENIECYLSLDVDEIYFANNASTDATAEVIATAIHGRSKAVLSTNAMNIGYSRSLFRAVLSAKYDKLAILSDEDCPSNGLFRVFRRALAAHPETGAMVRAASYPAAYAIAELEKHVDRSDPSFAFVPPGPYAAYLAYVQCAYMGGSFIARDQIRNLSNLTFESASYPHRLMIMDAAFHGGLSLILERDIGLFPKANASTKGGSSTPRYGDWCIGEWLQTAELLGTFYADGKTSAEATTTMREKLFKFVCQMFCTYFTYAARYGLKKAVSYLQSVQFTCTLMEQPRAWLHISEWMAMRADDEQRTMFKKACDALATESTEYGGLSRNRLLHNHVLFGRGPWGRSAQFGG